MPTEETPKTISKSEKTHAKNNESLHIAIAISESVGEIFATNNPLIQISSLRDFETGFSMRMQTVNEKFAAEQNAVDAQIAAFKLVSNRVSRTVKAARGLGLDPMFIENLQATAYRLYGVRVNKKTPDEILGGSSHSTSRRSYAGILESLDLFDEQLKSNPAYVLNEEQYKSATVTAWVQSLRDLHNTALQSKIDTRTARNDRDSFGYDEHTGIIPRMNALKAYMETILDKNDPRLKQLKKLRFRDYRR